MISESFRAVVAIIIFAGMISGCTSIKIAGKSKPDFVEVFDGQSKALLKYRLVDNEKTNLGFLFKPSETDTILKRVSEELYVDVFLLTKNKIKINLNNQYGDTLCREFKGRFDAGMFKFNTKWFVTGNPLVWGLGTHDNVLAKNGSGELMLYHTRGGVGFVTLIPIMGASNGQDMYKFKQ